MPAANDYGEPKAAHHRRGTQAVLNESWPLSDKAGGHARGIGDQPEPIDVEVRIEWGDGGEEWLPAGRTGGPRPTCLSASRTPGRRQGLFGSKLGEPRVEIADGRSPCTMPDLLRPAHHSCRVTRIRLIDGGSNRVQSRPIFTPLLSAQTSNKWSSTSTGRGSGRTTITSGGISSGEARTGRRPGIQAPPR